MSFRHLAKIVTGLAVFFTLTAAAQAQWGGEWRERGGWRGYRSDPASICADAAGQVYGIPSREFTPVDYRPVGNGVTRITLSGRKYLARCTIDSRGNVLNIR